MNTIILNLGCGKTKIPNSMGVDMMKIEDYVDIVHDLDLLPYPFASDSIDEIHMYHCLEHLHDPLKKLEEIYRILKNGGILHLRVPHFSSQGGFSDITHIRPFGYTSFDCLNNESSHSFYTKAKFNILKKEIKYFGLYPNKGLYERFVHHNQCVWYAKPLVRAVNFFINMNPIFFERIWCYWIGGACELVVDLKKNN